jgi:hypothetical protein
MLLLEAAIFPVQQRLSSAKFLANRQLKSVVRREKYPALDRDSPLAPSAEQQTEDVYERRRSLGAYWGRLAMCSLRAAIFFD